MLQMGFHFGQLKTLLRNVTHHTVGVCVTCLRHRQALDDLRSHPGESTHQGHARCVRQEPRCPKITDLK